MKKQYKNWVQLIVTLRGCDRETLSDKKSLKILVDQLIDICKMKPLGDAVVREIRDTPSSRNEGIDGITIMQAIRTSNIVLHSIPSQATCHLDLFSCKSFNQERVIKHVFNTLGASSITVKVLVR